MQGGSPLPVAAPPRLFEHRKGLGSHPDTDLTGAVGAGSDPRGCLGQTLGVSNDNPIDIAPFVDEIFNDVFAELQSRLSEPLTDLSEADRVAILTAIMKGAWRGVLSGIALQTHAVNEASHDVDVQTWLRGPEGDIGKPDLWAERYGQPAEGEE
jgi:hypothetical protein